ncbi:MAG: hypothetical protein WD750_07785 [Gammaproteobacteria bacterium]
MQQKRTATSRTGTVTVLFALWFSMFCNHCIAAAGDMPESGNTPADYCPHGNSGPTPDIPVDDRQTGFCEGDCESVYFTATLFPKVADDALVPSLSADDSDSAGPINQYGIAGTWHWSPISTYDTPERSYFPPFQRYTVLLN